MADRVARKLPLRHPAEIPMTILMVVLNIAILAVLIDFLTTTALIPPALRGTNWEVTIRAVAGAIVLVAPAIMVVRQVQRASIRGTAVLLSLPRSHPWTVRRIWRLHQLGLFGPAATARHARHAQGAA
jgi:hypothetical protein